MVSEGDGKQKSTQAAVSNPAENILYRSRAWFGVGLNTKAPRH
jgi:hypothetical protein